MDRRLGRPQVQTPWILDPDSGLGIIGLSTGSYEIIFAGSDRMLYAMAANGAVTLLGNGLGMAPHTSPAVAADQSGHLEVASGPARARTSPP
ncbi:hypothetical protein ABT369_47615 [Dactylosporangium sp. NPDC000244]|uniref:hypothetical protein n=1 Tax=Dactylosporangium sp. NPDC000244 TaxID=3154365 RepID=UPI00331ABC53